MSTEYEIILTREKINSCKGCGPDDEDENCQDNITREPLPVIFADKQILVKDSQTQQCYDPDAIRQHQSGLAVGRFKTDPYSRSKVNNWVATEEAISIHRSKQMLHAAMNNNFDLCREQNEIKQFQLNEFTERVFILAVMYRNVPIILKFLQLRKKNSTEGFDLVKMRVLERCAQQLSELYEEGLKQSSRESVADDRLQIVVNIMLKYDAEQTAQFLCKEIRIPQNAKNIEAIISMCYWLSLDFAGLQLRDRNVMTTIPKLMQCALGQRNSLAVKALFQVADFHYDTEPAEHSDQYINEGIVEKTVKKFQKIGENNVKNIELYKTGVNYTLDALSSLVSRRRPDRDADSVRILKLFMNGRKLARSNVRVPSPFHTELVKNLTREPVNEEHHIFVNIAMVNYHECPEFMETLFMPDEKEDVPSYSQDDLYEWLKIATEKNFEGAVVVLLRQLTVESLRKDAHKPLFFFALKTSNATIVGHFLKCSNVNVSVGNGKAFAKAVTNHRYGFEVVACLMQHVRLMDLNGRDEVTRVYAERTISVSANDNAALRAAVNNKDREMIKLLCSDRLLDLSGLDLSTLSYIIDV
jgi:hypothetical protein